MDTLAQEHSISKNSIELDHHLACMKPEKNLTSHCYSDSPVCSNDSCVVAQSTSEGDEPEEADYSDAILKYIGQMLMEEEDLEHKPCMFYDCMALQATERSFYNALNYEPKSNHSSVMEGNLRSLDDGVSRAWSSSQSSESSSDVGSWISTPGEPEKSSVQLAGYSDALKSSLQTNKQSFSSSYGFAGPVNGTGNLLGKNQTGLTNEKRSQLEAGEGTEERVENHSNRILGKKKRREDNCSAEDMRSNKLLASSASESDPLEMYDNVLLNQDANSGRDLVICSFPEAQSSSATEKLQQKRGSKQRNPGGKIQGITDVVDLRSLLMQCAQAVASYDNRTANELLKRIRLHSSPSGGATERLAHYFSNALEARLAGTGTALYTSFDLQKYSAAELLKAYHAYVTACPFRRVSNIFANKCIKKVASGATRLHIIDFGILYGFQWPCLIQTLSERPGGPPKLRITGIDFPQRGLRPAGRVEETGRRLEKYCKRFNVPFEYSAIAKKWETIQLEDLQIDKEEVLVVNCLYRLGNVPDETVVSSSPRDTVLNLIKRIKPDIFVHGVTNGTYNSAFFQTRFREALFHFSSLFDMFDATLPRDNHERMLYEKEVYGRDSMNVIACEGTERVERSETYKQWQVRNLRAGFKQLPLDREIVNYVRDKVKKCYHRDFVVDEDGNWMLQGWKGKVIYSLSCWKPNKKH